MLVELTIFLTPLYQTFFSRQPIEDVLQIVSLFMKYVVCCLLANYVDCIRLVSVHVQPDKHLCAARIAEQSPVRVHKQPYVERFNLLSRLQNCYGMRTDTEFPAKWRVLCGILVCDCYVFP